MKFLASCAIIVVLALNASYSPKVQANDLGALLAGICDTVESDNKSRFRKKLKDARVKLRNIYDGVTCGGMNLVRYAMQSKADSVGEFIVSRMPASHFAGSGDADWAAANGLGDSVTAKAIASR